MVTSEELARRRADEGSDSERLALPELLEMYASALERALGVFKAGTCSFKVPRLVGLRRRCGSPFHATPELFFAQLGATEFRMPEETFHVRAGDVCLIPRGMPHGERVMDRPGRFLTLITMFWPDGFSLHYGHAARDGKVISDPHTRFKVAGLQIPQYLDEVARAMNEAEGRTTTYAEGLMIAALGAMIEALKTPYEYGVPGNHLIGRCLGLVQVNLHETKLSVQWLAERLGCTPDHLSRAFQKNTGRSLIDTINQARIEHAVNLLANSSFNIGEIAWASGFSTQSYFNRVFIKRMAMTPKQYRASIGTLPVKAGPGVLGSLLG